MEVIIRKEDFASDTDLLMSEDEGVSCDTNTSIKPIQIVVPAATKSHLIKQ